MSHPALDKINGWATLLRLILPALITIMLFWMGQIRDDMKTMSQQVYALSKMVIDNKELSNENYYLLSNEFKTEMSGVKERLVRLETRWDGKVTR